MYIYIVYAACMHILYNYLMHPEDDVGSVAADVAGEVGGGVDAGVGGDGAAPPAPPLRGRGRGARRGEGWGRGRWELAIIERDGVVVGYGATCKDHEDPGDSAVCKKSVTIGKNGLSLDELKLRLKRWLIAGIDDDDWGEDKRTKHVGMGGLRMVEFAVGLSEEECDRIANAA